MLSFVKSAPDKLALDKSAPVKLAPDKSVPVKLALVKLASFNLAPVKLAPGPIKYVTLLLFINNLQFGGRAFGFPCIPTP